MCETPMGREEEPGWNDELDGLVQVLAHPVRRAVLRRFATNPAGVTLEGLARVVAEERAGSVDEAALRELRLTLHHSHLPKLEAAGLLTYDPECGRVDPNADEGSHLWRAVTAMDGVVTLAANDARRTDAAHADGRLSAN